MFPLRETSLEFPSFQSHLNLQRLQFKLPSFRWWQCSAARSFLAAQAAVRSLNLSAEVVAQPPVPNGTVRSFNISAQRAAQLSSSYLCTATGCKTSRVDSRFVSRAFRIRKVTCLNLHTLSLKRSSRALCTMSAIDSLRLIPPNVDSLLVYSDVYNKLRGTVGSPESDPGVTPFNLEF